MKRVNRPGFSTGAAKRRREITPPAERGARSDAAGGAVFSGANGRGSKALPRKTLLLLIFSGVRK